MNSPLPIKKHFFKKNILITTYPQWATINIIPNIPFEPNPPTKQLRQRETNMQSIKIDNRLRFSYKIRSKFKELKTLLKQQQYIIVQWIYLRMTHLHSCDYGRDIVPAPPQKMT